MQLLEDIIVENCLAKEAKLYGPSKKAAENPSHGITVNIPAAVHVIQDCASMAYNYIPHYCFGVYANPFSTLYKKVSLDQIKDFVERAETSIVTQQLMKLILDKGSNLVLVPESDKSSEDPYGDYNANTAKPLLHNNIYTFSKLFGVI